MKLLCLFHVNSLIFSFQFLLIQSALSCQLHLNYKFSWSIAMSKRTWGQPTIVLLILEFTLSNNHRARPTFNVVPMPLIPMKIPCWVFLVPICTWTSSVLQLLLHVHNDFLLQTLYYNEYYDFNYILMELPPWIQLLYSVLIFEYPNYEFPLSTLLQLWILFLRSTYHTFMINYIWI